MSATGTTKEPSAQAACPGATAGTPGHATSGSRGGGHPRFRRPGEWKWRQRIRSNKRSLQIYRTVVASFGLVVVLVGLALVPLPGPGWLIVFIGVSIWASEFHWARRLHTFGVAKVKLWDAWVRRQSYGVRGGLAVMTCVFVNAVLWATIRVMGIPGWVPEQVAAFMRTHLAL